VSEGRIIKGEARLFKFAERKAKQTASHEVGCKETGVAIGLMKRAFKPLKLSQLIVF